MGEESAPRNIPLLSPSSEPVNELSIESGDEGADGDIELPPTEDGLFNKLKSFDPDNKVPPEILERWVNYVHKIDAQRLHGENIPTTIDRMRSCITYNDDAGCIIFRFPKN